MAAESIPAESHPNRNEDQFLLMPDQGAAAVFDGVGGKPKGQEAARRAAGLVREKILALPSELTPEQLAQHLERILSEIDQTIAEERSGRTTATIMLIRPTGENYDLTIGNVADSRAYLLDAEGFRALTIDNQLERQDKATEEQLRESQRAIDRATTFEELPNNRKAYFAYGRFEISQSVGRGDARPVLYRESAPPGSRVLLSSDGIHDNLTADEIATILQQYDDPPEAAHALIEAALTRSRDKQHARHKPDDMTAVVLGLK